MSLLNILKENKTQILLAEFGALLHDLDKMSYKYFLDDYLQHDLKSRKYREKKYDGKNVNKIKEERLGLLISELEKTPFSLINTNSQFIGEYRGVKTTAKINTTDDNTVSSPFIFHHELRDVEFPFISAIVHAGICGCDGIDSELDKTGGDVQFIETDEDKRFRIDTPFGHLSQYVFAIEKEVEKYNLINEIIKTKFENELDSKNRINGVFSSALGGTKYPFNDVTLWAHSYSVASMTKATLAKILIESTFLTNQHNEEEQYSIPARTPWEDGNATDFTFLRICFDRDSLLVKAQKAGDIVGFDEQIVELKNEIQEYIEKELLIGNEVYRDEDIQLFVIPKLGTWEAKKTIFGSIHNEFKKEVRTEIDNKIQILLENKNCHEFAYEIAFSKITESNNGNVAQRILDRSRELLDRSLSCRQNPKLLIKIINNNKNQGRCPVCNVRYAEKNDDKLCSICLKRRTEHNRRRINIPVNTVNLEDCLAPEDNKLVLITAQFDLSSIRKGSIFESVQWKVEGRTVTKNPSPGRLYRCWETLETFFREFVEDVVPNDTEIKKLFDKGENEKDIKTFRITLSPKTLQFITTAQAAPAVINKMYELYEKQFGKFRNNLPLSIGAIFFYSKFPLYAVLDAAKNMKTLLKPGVETNWEVIDPVTNPVPNINSVDTKFLFLKPPAENGFGNNENVIEWKIPITLSNDKSDKFHPNFKVNNSDAINTKHISEIQSGDFIQVTDGKFEFILLDSAVHRHSIMHDKIRHHVFGSRKTYNLSVISLFPKLEELVVKLTDTQIKQMESLLIEKMLSWKIEWKKAVEDANSSEKKTIENFCKAVLFSKNAFGKKSISEILNKNDKKLLVSSAVSGLLIDFLDIKLHCASGR